MVLVKLTRRRVVSARFYSTPSLDTLKETFVKYDRPNSFARLLEVNAGVAQLKRASVLVPISISEGKTYYTLSKRTDLMKSFKGEVCFLGGKKDNAETDVDTAFREAKEEANVDAASLTYLAQLPPLMTFNQVIVTPVIAYFDKSHFKPVLNATEVELIFDLPTERFLTNANHKTKLFSNASGQYLAHYFKDKIGDRIITTWGFTAFLAIVISSVLHSRTPTFDVFPGHKLTNHNLNQFLEKFFFNKLAVSNTHYKNQPQKP